MSPLSSMPNPYNQALPPVRRHTKEPRASLHFREAQGAVSFAAYKKVCPDDGDGLFLHLPLPFLFHSCREGSGLVFTSTFALATSTVRMHRGKNRLNLNCSKAVRVSNPPFCDVSPPPPSPHAQFTCSLLVSPSGASFLDVRRFIEIGLCSRVLFSCLSCWWLKFDKKACVGPMSS